VHHAFAGLDYAECITATGVRGGVARNVVPGSAEIDINYRYPPGMDPDAAERTLERHLHGYGEAMVIGHAPSGAVTLEHPLAQRLIALSGAPPEPKQAWTPVAEFTAVGVDAVNFGPGDPPLAHQVDESVGVAELVHAYDLLSTLLTSGAA
jgi:succinyl-diaminopimelate desuccinylase